MPIYQGDAILPQVYLGNNKIYRVYKGNELEHGIFNAFYNVGPGSVSTTSQEFTWGIGLSSLPSANCDGATFNGGYTEKMLSNKITSISKDIKVDTNLYAYFEKSKTQYSGQYQWQSYEKIKDAGDEQVGHEGGGGSQSFSPLSRGWHYGMYSGNDCAAGCKARRNSLGSYESIGMGTTPTSSYTPKAGALARGGNSIGTAVHIAFVETVENGTPVYSHGNGDRPPYGAVYVTTSSGLSYPHLGYIYTSLCTDSSGDGYGETVHHDAEYGYVTKYGTAGGQDSSTPPQGSWSSGNPQTRVVYSHYEYNSNNGTDGYTK